MRVLAVLALAGAVFGQRGGGPPPRNQQQGRGGQQQGRGGQQQGPQRLANNLDMCRAVRDEGTCGKVESCVWTEIPAMLQRGGGGGPQQSGRGGGGGRPGPGRRRLQRGQGRGGRDDDDERRGPGPRGSGRGSGSGMRTTMGCISECFLVKEESACQGSCRWVDGQGRMSGSGRGRGSGPRRGPGPGPGRRLLQRGQGGRDQGRGQGPPRQSGRGRQSGSGGQQPRCVPMPEKVDTGLEVVIKIYTDQDCTELFEPDQDQNQGPMQECRDKKEEECEKLTQCEWGEGNDRFSEEHCRPAFRRGSGSGRGSGPPRGSGRGRGGRPGPGRRRLQRGGIQRGRGNQQNQRQQFQNDQRNGRGQDFDDRGRGGNQDQRRRLTSNTITRMIPVIDDRGQPKCNFDSRGDVQAMRFRKTTCKYPNALETEVYDDVLCTKESLRVPDLPLMTRGECIPLPTPGGRGGGPRGSGSGRRGSGSGRGSGRGRGGRPGPGPGRRRLVETDEKECDGEWDEDVNYNSLVDWLNELTCIYNQNTDDDDEKKEGEEQRERRDRNPCNGLGRAECAENDECDYQRNVCVWNNAPENERNLYAIYEWQYLTKDGELTEEEFCYQGDKIKTKEAHENMCEALDEESTCLDHGCKSFKNGKCSPQKKKVKCKKIGSKLDKKSESYAEDFKRLCNMYSEYPGKGNQCEVSEKKGKFKCKGGIKL